MISELHLVRSHTSLWRKVLPFQERLTRKINLEKKHVLPPILLGGNPRRRSIVNELGFRIFEVMWVSEAADPDIISDALINELSSEVIMYIARIEHENPLGIPSLEEIQEAKIISERIFEYFKNFESGDVVVSPRFSGCGVVNNCKGDVLVDRRLYEIKSGEREFRSYDIKQLLVYCALNYAKHSRLIDEIGLLNPRLGTSVVLTIQEAIEVASGRSVSDCFNEIINFVDSPDDFR